MIVYGNPHGDRNKLNNRANARFMNNAAQVRTSPYVSQWVTFVRYLAKDIVQLTPSLTIYLDGIYTHS